MENGGEGLPQELRQEIAVKLRIPCSGGDRLNRMIARAERRDIATAAMQGFMANSEYDMRSDALAAECFKIADAMMAEENKGE